MEKKYLFLGLLFIGIISIGMFVLYNSYGEGSLMYESLNDKTLLSKEEQALLSPLDITPDKFSTYQLTIDNGLKISYDDWYVTFQPYFVMNNGQVYTWNQIPSSIEKILWKKQLTPTKYKYGADFNNISQNVRDNIKYIVFHRSDVENLTFDDINISGNSIIIKNKLTIDHDDFLKDYSIVKINKTDIVLGDIQGKNVERCDDPMRGINCTQVFKSNFRSNGDGTYFITFDPTVTLDGTTSYDSIDTNITQETGFAHLNTSITDPYSNLIFYIPFDSNVSNTTFYDYTGNNNDGTVFGNITSVNAFYGNGIDIAGSEETYVDVGDIDDVDKTIMLWVKITEAGRFHTLISKRNSFGSNPWGLDVDFTTGDNRIVFGWNGAAHYTGVDSLTVGEWTHIAVTHNPGTSAPVFYINGQLASSSAWFGGTPGDIQNNEVIKIGKNGDGLSMNGTVDEVMYFNKSLTATQINDIYNNQSARFIPQGTQLFNDTNVSSDGTENRLNITLTDYQHLMGSNISVEVNGTYFNVSDDGTINNLEFTSDPNFLNITFKYIAGTNSFYSPLLIGNITLDSWNEAGVTDDEYPVFSNYWDDNASLIESGTGSFNVTLTSTNGTVLLDINGVNTTAENITADVYNASYTFSSSGDYIYRWHSWGNGTSNNYNVSNDQSYTVNASADTCSPSSPLSANYQFECSDNCVQSTTLDAGGFNIIFNGSGTFSTTANIFNYLKVSIFGESSANKCVVTCNSGGCFIG